MDWYPEETFEIVREATTARPLSGWIASGVAAAVCWSLWVLDRTSLFFFVAALVFSVLGVFLGTRRARAILHARKISRRADREEFRTKRRSRDH